MSLSFSTYSIFSFPIPNAVIPFALLHFPPLGQQTQTCVLEYHVCQANSTYAWFAVNHRDAKQILKGLCLLFWRTVYNWATESSTQFWWRWLSFSWASSLSYEYFWWMFMRWNLDFYSRIFYFLRLPWVIWLFAVVVLVEDSYIFKDLTWIHTVDSNTVVRRDTVWWHDGFDLFEGWFVIRRFESTVYNIQHLCLPLPIIAYHSLNSVHLTCVMLCEGLRATQARRCMHNSAQFSHIDTFKISPRSLRVTNCSCEESRCMVWHFMLSAHTHIYHAASSENSFKWAARGFALYSMWW